MKKSTSKNFLLVRGLNMSNSPKEKNTTFPDACVTSLAGHDHPMLLSKKLRPTNVNVLWRTCFTSGSLSHRETRAGCVCTCTCTEAGTLQQGFLL